MNIWFVLISFVVVAICRVLQKVCSKKVSLIIDNRFKFFHYGGYYMLVSALFSLITLCVTGFYGFNLPTFLCALISALLFAIDLFTGIEVVKGTTLIVCNMFSLGGLFVPCVLGIFLFNEPMSLWQWLGLVLFVLSTYFISAKRKEEKKPFSFKTLILLIISFFVSGLVMVVQKYFALLVPNGNVALFSALTFGLNSIIMYICLFVLFALKAKERTPDGKRLRKIEPLDKTMLICGALLALSLFAINLLITTLATTVPSAILFTVSSALSIMITCAVGALVYKEKLNLKNVVGLILGFASIVIVSVL